jgi:5,10-methylenetetrahydrofolate reductase
LLPDDFHTGNEKIRNMESTELVLEMVPPPLSDQRAGIARCLDYIRQVRAAVPVEAVNIPEIREEGGRRDNGERLTPFMPRVPPRELAAHIKDSLDLEAIVNHCVVHEPAGALEKWLDTAWRHYGVRRFVLVGGEHSHVDYPGPTVREATGLARRLFTGKDVKIGNICIPSRSGERERVRGKISAGADFFTTQIIYHVRELIDLCDPDGLPDADFYVSFCPVRSKRNILFLNWLGVIIDPALERWLLAGNEDVLARSESHLCATWEAFVDHINRYEHPLRAHINLSPIGRITPRDTIRLARSLRAAGESATEKPSGRFSR